MSFKTQIIEIDVEAVQTEAENILRAAPGSRRDHAAVLEEILECLVPIDFRSVAGVQSDQPVPQKVKVVLAVQAVLNKAEEMNCALCRNQDFIYAYNGEFWQLIDRSALENFLGEAAERVGVDTITSRHYKFKKELLSQFFTAAYLPTPERTKHVLVNLKDATFEITEEGHRVRNFDPKDFLTYQLPFRFDETASCPKWQRFLDEVVPDASRQAVLAEFIGYVFAQHLKLEKTLILYGTGANGKSVFFDVINALLGPENVSNISLESICKDQYYRALIADKLLNYSSEISSRLQAEKFKQLASGEPIEARLPYGQPMTLEQYARLAFNCNELPSDVEHTEAFFRRFLIIPFRVTIPENKRNSNLAKEIIENELSGVFNWVKAGLERLLLQNCFSHCEAAEVELAAYKRDSDTVAMFTDDEGYQRSTKGWVKLKDLYQHYRNYCIENGLRPVSSKKLVKRLARLGYEAEKYAVGKVVYIEK